MLNYVSSSKNLRNSDKLAETYDRMLSKLATELKPENKPMNDEISVNELENIVFDFITYEAR